MNNKFSQEQRVELSNNTNVSKCSEKAITYAKDFKVRAVKQYIEEGRGAREIFKLAGFDLKMVGKDTPKSCLGDWCKIFRTKGVAGLQIENRGGRGRRTKSEGMTEKKRIEYLEAEVAYLRAENDFLIELRAKRRAE